MAKRCVENILCKESSFKNKCDKINIKLGIDQEKTAFISPGTLKLLFF